MNINADAESFFKVDDYNEEKNKLQITNFFLGLLYHLPIQNHDILAKKFWEVLKNIDKKDIRDNTRRDLIFKLLKIEGIKDIQQQCTELNLILRFLEIDPTFQAVIKDNKIVVETLNMEILKPHTVSLKIKQNEKIVFGAAPEFIKPFLARNEKIPEYIILAKNTFKHGLNFAEIEFSIYNNFFMQGGRKVKVVCTHEQEKQLRNILKITLMGPDFDEMLKNEREPVKKKEYLKLKSFFELLVPRDKDRNIIQIDGYVEFIHFTDFQAQITLSDEDKINIISSRDNPDAFTICNEIGEIIGYIDLSKIYKQEFSFPVQRTPLSRDEFGFFVLDSGDGFSPDKHTSSFLLWLEGMPLLVDPMAYSDLYLKRKGIDSSEIVDIFISHNHGDHDQGVFNYIINERKIRLIGSEIVINQTLEKVAASINKSLEQLKKIVDVVELPVGREVKIEGYDNITLELEYGLHSIPSTMVKIRYKDYNGKTVKTLGYSGDTIFDLGKYKTWKDQGYLNKETVDILSNFFINADVIIHEAGEGTIHTKMEKVVEQYKNKEIYWVHTPLMNSNLGKKVLVSGDQVTLIPEQADKKIEWYFNIFAKVPLLANLSHEEIYQFAKKAAQSKEFEVVTYLAGELIIKEGDLPKDNSFYIIAQGSVDILQNGQHIASLGVGQQLGEMALFGSNEGRRNATVRAFTGIKLIKIREAAYKNFINKIERAYLNYSEARPVLEASNSPFKDLNHHILDNIAVRMEREVYEERSDGKKNILITKGQPHNKAFYLILEGEVGAIVDKEKGIGFKVGKGSVLGEMSMLDENLLPTATVVTISKKVIVYTLSKKAFLEIIDKYPPVRYILEGISDSRKKINENAKRNYLKKMQEEKRI